MDLLLEKRYHLDTVVTKKEKERRANGNSSSDTDKKQVRGERGGRGRGEEGEGEGGKMGGRGGTVTSKIILINCLSYMYMYSTNQE